MTAGHSMRLVRADAVVEMPPVPTWFTGHAVQVLTCTGTGVARIVAFIEPRLFATFGLPQELPPGAATSVSAAVSLRAG